ncbi:DUF4328 domain-containing protein [Streptomyces sp. H39-S7]|uniref:DUF4328 domain-containing protein n=1 Tax=Streptomyces sp. H39-S7 TaxID=3004357 RepID=UPI0022AE9280|nr:DUF4328 domain-containing protein [Streptomyces sp. H39-S7]MCZ4123393.1 DUF4328 domain-containing protein [Streptomyces sp. H39-S7]
MANDIWNASTPPMPDGSPSRVKYTLLNVWWTLWVSSSVLGQVLARAFDDSGTAESIRTADTAFMFSDVVSIAAAVAAILVVRKLSDRQRAKVYYAQPVPYEPLPVGHPQ